MKESQRTEWKESWRDDHLRWVCGFANAEGGVLVIGRDDKGRVVGVPDATRLLEELPNKPWSGAAAGSNPVLIAAP
ncbi:MAG TPA: ATP-binding protein [Thermoanaerobaculia bacterium]|jgi:ATP-dependent DNA helicase RecG|nr:ATP-binding protein [Thermoanaerobaculia bacterium]